MAFVRDTVHTAPRALFQTKARSKVGCFGFQAQTRERGGTTHGRCHSETGRLLAHGGDLSPPEPAQETDRVALTCVSRAVCYCTARTLQDILAALGVDQGFGLSSNVDVGPRCPCLLWCFSGAANRHPDATQHLCAVDHRSSLTHFAHLIRSAGTEPAGDPRLERAGAGGRGAAVDEVLRSI